MSRTNCRFPGLVDQDWPSLAAWQSADPDLIFPISSSGQSIAQVVEAKAICARCQVQRECLAFALCGVGPADSTGKPSVTYWPGGTRPSSSSEGWRRWRKPCETGLLMTSQRPDRPALAAAAYRSISWSAITSRSFPM
jgi:Transcription factor WhiB